MKQVFKNLYFNKYTFILFLCLYAVCSTAQSPINYVEYYIDQDPGIGKGTSVPVTAATTLTNNTFNVNTSVLSKGIHILGCRAKTTSGIWSMGHRWFIFKPYDSLSQIALPNITKVEYYLDKDPGIGKATSISVTASTNIVDAVFTLNNVNTINKGTHILGFRAMDANGRWSQTSFWLFQVPFASTIPSTATNINKVEYFIDKDPGLGLATSVTVTPATDIADNNFSANIGTIGAGTHIIGVRAKDVSNNWSMTNFLLFVKPFAATNQASLVNVTAAEYFIDYDLGAGKGTPISITPGTNLSDVAFNADLTGIIPGSHNLLVRVKDANGKWSMLNDWEFTISGTAPTITTVVSTTALCAGSQINVGYQFSGSIALKANNTFIAQLSDENGSFKDPVNIGTFASSSNGTNSILCTIPNTVARTNLIGSAYRIRIITTNQSVVGNDNGSNITIYGVPQTPQIVNPIITDTTVCKFNALTIKGLTTGSYNYQWLLNGNPISGATSADYSIGGMSVSDTGLYQLRSGNPYSPGSACNAVSITKRVRINSNVPNIPTLTPNGAVGVCLGNSATLSSSSATAYQWYKNDVAISGATSQTYNSNTAGTYTVSVGNGNGCLVRSTQSAVITLGLAATKPNVIPTGSLVFCQGSGVTLNSSAFTGNQWYKNGVAISGQTNTSLYASESGYYKTIVTGGGCTITSDSILVTANPYISPSVSLSASGNNVPVGTTITFTATPVNGGGLPNYAFYVGGSLVQNNASNTYSSNTITNGTSVYCVMTSNGNCVSPTTANSNSITITYSPPVTVAGRVYHYNGTIIPSVKVFVSNGKSDSTICDANGRYSFSLNQQLNYSVSPFKNNDQNKTNGVNALDVVKIQSHILSSVLLGSPYKIIAADVNGDGMVSVTDVVLIKRLILGIDTTFNGKLWTFVDSSFVFSTPTNPFPYPSSKSYTNLSANQNNQSLIGLKLGDVTFDWTPVLGVNKIAKKNAVKIFYDETSLEQDGSIRLKIRTSNFKQLIATQFGLHFNNEIFRLKSIENKQLPFEENLLDAKNGNINFIWIDKSNAIKTLPDGSYLFDIILEKKKEFTTEILEITENSTSCLAVNKNVEELPIQFGSERIINKYNESQILVNEYKIEVAPNPTTGNALVFIESKVSKKVELLLYDIYGNVVLSKFVDVVAGSNKIPVNFKQKRAVLNGIYYLKVSGIDSLPIKEVAITNN